MAKLFVGTPRCFALRRADQPPRYREYPLVGTVSFANADAVILVSHDRAFINNVTNRTLEISCGKVVDYRVKYDEYVELRAERREKSTASLRKSAEGDCRHQGFHRAFPLQTHQIGASAEPHQAVGKDCSDRNRRSRHFTSASEVPAVLAFGRLSRHLRRSGETLRRSSGFDHVNLTIKRGEKVAFVGKNGEGKSTLVKCIMSQIDHGGELKLGHNVEIGLLCAKPSPAVGRRTHRV